MKNLFLDCGSNLGQGFEEFKNMFGIDNIDYHLFEPNPFCFQELTKKYSQVSYITLHNTAVGIEDKTVQFYYKNNFDVGGTVVFEHGNNLFSNTRSHLTSVTCINLINHIQHVLKFYDKIFMKLDIESAEYDILEKLIETKLIHNLSKLFVEFHSQYMDPETKKYYELRERNILDYIKNNNIDFTLWK